MKKLHMISFLLLVVGGLNWLAVGLFERDIVSSLLSPVSSLLVQAVFVLVGLSAVYEVVTHKGKCKECSM